MSLVVIIDQLLFDQELFSISTIEGRTVRLSKMEVEILRLLCADAGRTVTRTFLFENAWPNGTGNDGHLNRVIVLLRRKFESLGMNDVIKTMPKVGYSVEKAVAIHDSDSFFKKNHSPLNLPDSEGHLYAVHHETFFSPDPLVNIKTTISSKKQKITYGSIAAMLIFIIVCGMIYFSQEDTEQFFSLGNLRVHSEDEKNHSVFYSDKVFESIQERVETLGNIDINTSTNIGKYYIGLSVSAISIVYLEEKNDYFVKRVFLRNKSASINDELSCALRDVNQAITNKEFLKNKKNIFNEHAMVLNKTFEYIVNTGCPYKKTESANWILNLSYSSSSDGLPYFISIAKIEEIDGEIIFKVINDGYVDVINKKNRSYNIWRSKTISLEKHDDFDENISAFKLLEAYSKTNYTANTVKINNGIYFSDFLDGMIMSFL